MASAMTRATRRCARWDACYATWRQRTRVTISASLGIFVGWLPGEPIDAYMKRADKAVYKAKAEGRDRLVHAEAA